MGIYYWFIAINSFAEKYKPTRVEIILLPLFRGGESPPGVLVGGDADVAEVVDFPHEPLAGAGLAAQGDGAVVVGTGGMEVERGIVLLLVAIGVAADDNLPELRRGVVVLG